MTLLELAERCEAAPGQDRRLDSDIHDAVFRTPPISDDEIERLSARGEMVISGCTLWQGDLTISLDAAMTLVPKGAWWELNADGSATVVVDVCHGDWDEVEYDRETCKGQAATPALALCAAALKARAASVDTLPKGEDREDGLRAEQG